MSNSLAHQAPSSLVSRPLAEVDGWSINLPDEATAIRELLGAAHRGEGFSCVTLNLDHLVKLRQSEDFRRAYRAAAYVTADGAPVAMIARRQHAGIARTTGADLLVPLCKAAAREDLPVYLFGTSDDVLAKASATLRRETNGRLQIAGMASPSRNFDPQGPEAEAAIRAIERSGARLCFVLLGAPKQEQIAARAVGMGVKTGFVCCGAAADFIAGQQVRAPRLMQATGTEWLWRLASNPRRLALRYWRCAVLLARIEVAERVFARSHRA